MVGGYPRFFLLTLWSMFWREPPHMRVEDLVRFPLHVLGRLAPRGEEVALVGRLEVVEHGLGLFFHFLFFVRVDGGE